MEIQKIFTDLYNSERIYSVLMNEEELSLFSEIQKESENKISKAGIGMATTGVGLGVGGHMLDKSGFNQFAKSSEGQFITNTFKNPGSTIAQQEKAGEMYGKTMLGKGSKDAVNGFRKMAGGTVMKKVGIGLGVLGAGKMLYDSFKKKKN